MDARTRRNTSRRVALELQYDGTRFCGWQSQNKGHTVQGELESALEVFFGTQLTCYASGRTDAGVHATAQVVHFDIPDDRDVYLQRLAFALNGIMSRDVSIKNVYAVPSDFHARFWAKKREYRYLIYNDRLKSPFMYERAMWIPYALEIEYIREALSYLEGEHDFTSFCKTKSAAIKPTVRVVRKTAAHREGPWISITIAADSFVHNMIRIIIGTLFEMIKHKKPASAMKEILDHRDRRLAGLTAPPFGLYLQKIFYDPSLHLYPHAFGE